MARENSSAPLLVSLQPSASHQRQQAQSSPRLQVHATSVLASLYYLNRFGTQPLLIALAGRTVRVSSLWESGLPGVRKKEF